LAAIAQISGSTKPIALVFLDQLLLQRRPLSRLLHQHNLVLLVLVLNTMLLLQVSQSL
jgi:hypothetical protein